MFQLIKGSSIAQESKITIGRIPYGEALSYVRDFLAERDHYTSEDELKQFETLKYECMRGVAERIPELINYIINVLTRYGIEVKGMSLQEAALNIYKDTWGLSVIEDIYNDPEVDEVEVNGINNIYSIKRGKSCRETVAFLNEEDLMAVIKRIFVDFGDVNEGRPVARTVRADGTRVLATVPRFTSTITLTLRKHKTFVYSKKTLEEVGTMEDRIYDMLALFNRGLVNILYSGPTNGGKTSMLRHFFRYSPPNIRTILLEPRHELCLQENYPDWNIVEFQELPQLNLYLKHAFETALQMTPVRIITGEILGDKEGPESIKSGTRGHSGNLTTLHTGSIKNSIKELTNILVEHGQQNVTREQAMERVCDAFDIIVQIYVSPTSGVKKVIAVGEPRFVNGDVEVINYVEWVPLDNDYLTGYWKYENPFSERLVTKLHRNGISIVELKRAGWIE
ncbi:ATPase, T2SS/T4P/T4SS family [Desulfoscipio gibsoniae]